MNNLGLYQWMTTVAKKVGGPVNFMVLTGTAGAAIYKIGEILVKKSICAFKSSKSQKLEIEATHNIYKVTSDGISNEGLKFLAGDQFKIIETDGDSILIEKIGDTNNPYFVSAKLLHEISDYTG